MKKAIGVLFFTLVTILVTILIDRGIGLFIGKDESRGLLFPPHSKAAYKTLEFQFTASINNLGFRDREFRLSKSAASRVIAIGDSFTYGWGVSVDESWPKVLERNLKSRGLSVEIANLGAPGASPINYADTAEKAIPLLKPDLVVVAVLQGEDLAQLKPKPVKVAPTFSPLIIKALISRMVHRMYPNTIALAHKVRTERVIIKEQSVATEWEGEAAHVLAEFTPGEKKRYESLDPLTRDAFINGKLNPYLIQTAIKFPDLFLLTLRLNEPGVKVLINEMSKQFDRIKKVADQYGARVIIISVPFGIYFDRHTVETRQRHGFFVEKDMLVSDAPDQAIRLASEQIGLQFFKVTDRFRNEKHANFSFEQDGHFNASGNQFYADQLTDMMQELITASMKTYSSFFPRKVYVDDIAREY